MKCPKCGFVGFDHARTCAKCGQDLDAVRQDLNLFDFAPSAPAFILDAILALSHKATSASAAAAAVASAAGGEEPGGSLDLLGEIDLKVDLDEKPEEITLELLDEGEEPPAEPEPAVVVAPEVLTIGDVPGGESALPEAQPTSEEAWPEALDLKIDGDAEATQEPGVFDLSDVEAEPEFAASLGEEGMTDEALERLRRELESADGILKDIEKDGVAIAEAEAEPAAVALEPEPTEEVVAIEEGLALEVREPDAPDETRGGEEKDEDVFILMEERDGGLAVQEFSLEDTSAVEPAGEEAQEEAFVLDLDALTEEEATKPAEVDMSKKEEPVVDGLVLELEDGFYIEPDDEEER